MNEPRIYQARVYCRFVFALSWGIGGLGLLSPLIGGRPVSSSNLLWYLAVYSASITGLVLEAVYGGRIGLQRMLARLIPWRSGLHW